MPYYVCKYENVTTYSPTCLRESEVKTTTSLPRLFSNRKWLALSTVVRVRQLAERVNNSQIRSEKRVNGTIETMESGKGGVSQSRNSRRFSYAFRVYLFVSPPQTVPGRSESTPTYAATGSVLISTRYLVKKLLYLISPLKSDSVMDENCNFQMAKSKLPPLH